MLLHNGDHTFEGQNGKLKYKFSKSTSDRRHLLVIFSGFRDKGTLDFGRALDGIRNNILWIYDEFEEAGENCYYYMAENKTEPRDLVDEFLESVCTSLNLEWSNISVAGFSKGGSAALYYGLRHRVGAVISTVPQFLIGRYVRQSWPAVFDFMRGSEEPDIAQKTLDAVIPQTLAGHADAQTYVYVLTSPADHQYEEEIKPYLGELRQLAHFNLLVSESPLITQHNEVTAYNVPALMSLFQLTADGLYPEFGEVHTSVDASGEIAAAQRSYRQGVANVEQIMTSGGRLDIKAATFIRGVAQPDYSSMSRELQVVLASGEKTILPLGKGIDKTISRRYVQETFVDYRAASSTTPNHAGYALSAFPEGKSKLSVSMRGKSGSSSVIATVTTLTPQFRHSIDNDFLLLWNSDEDGAEVERRTIRDIPVSWNSFVSIDELHISDEHKFHIHGWFAPLGTTINQWGDALYYLVLANEERSYTFQLGMLDKAKLAQQIDLSATLSKAYVSDIRNQGVDLSQVLTGDYEASLLCVNKDVVARTKKIASLAVDTSSLADKPKVGVLGSCIVRDVFNSKFVADWHNRNQLVSAAHQSALVSLASKPYAGEKLDYSDLDKHSVQCVDEDLSKSVIEKLEDETPEFVFIDLFSDARFGVKDVKGSYITDNAWKIGASPAYKKLADAPVISMHNSPEQYLELFEQAAHDLYERLSARGKTTFVLVKVRATENLRDDSGDVKSMPGPAKILNDAFEKLEQKLAQAVPSLVILDMTDFTEWANKDHPWSAYVVHYEQSYYEALDAKMRELIGTGRRARIIP